MKTPLGHQAIWPQQIHFCVTNERKRGGKKELLARKGKAPLNLQDMIDKTTGVKFKDQITIHCDIILIMS